MNHKGVNGGYPVFFRRKIRRKKLIFFFLFVIYFNIFNISEMEVCLGSVKLNSPIMNAAGCYCSDYDHMNILASLNGIGAVVSKSSTMIPRVGNPLPNKFIGNDTSVNAIGLANLGVEYFSQYYSSYYSTSNTTTYIQSIYVDQNEIMKTFEFVNRLSPRVFEFNIECPNIKSADRKSEKYEDMIRMLRDNISEKHIWGLKLPVFFHEREFDDMASILRVNTPNFITTSNTVPHGLMISSRGASVLSTGYGGVGGLKPFGLANTCEFHTRLPGLSIIGCGGIKTAADVIDYVRCGATCVQIGSALYQYGPKIIEYIYSDLKRSKINLNLIRGTFYPSKL